MDNRTYIAIDLKSFYASVECVERGLDPMNTHLVVADPNRTEKTICLAVSPTLKAHGIPGRARLFEVVQKAKQINAGRCWKAPGHCFTASSYIDSELKDSSGLELEYIVATPQMALYIDYSTRIYNTYLKYVAPEDIHVYSIDEVFIDATPYLKAKKLSPREFAVKMVIDVLSTTGITATAGIGTNLYLAKVAMDIVAKHVPADENGVRIAELDEMSYRQLLWSHRPITDFWRVGRGYAKKLETYGLYTMGDVARCSVGKATDAYNEALLYTLFGVNAELLIDHAWGWEPVTMAEVKGYKPSTSSMGTGQVLMNPYAFEKAKLVVREMADLLALDLVEKGLVTDQIVLTVSYDIENLQDPDRRRKYRGPITKDHYGREKPKHAHGTAKLEKHSSSAHKILEAISALFDKIVDESLTVRRVYITANNVISASDIPKAGIQQLDFFTDYAAVQKTQADEEIEQEREKNRQAAVLKIKKKYGRNAILKGVNLEEGATTRTRNEQIGGHRA